MAKEKKRSNPDALALCLARISHASSPPIPCAHQLFPSPRSRGEGRGEGVFCEFGQEHLENSIEVLDDIVVPNANHAIAEGAKCAIAAPVFRTFRVLAAVELNNQPPLAANKIHVVSSNRLLAHEFEAAELPGAKPGPQRELCRREGAPQQSRTLITLLILAPHRLGSWLAPHPDPLPASGAREGHPVRLGATSGTE
jgi:hypothetical protein